MFFFFKQKTAYEMRISDWSSDVCSSDLCGNSWREGQAGTAGYKSMTRIGSPRESRDPSSIAHGRRHYLRVSDVATSATRAASGSRGMTSYVYGSELDIIVRSEEHTSELQSLMRISYAVFCLQKKKTQT